MDSHIVPVNLGDRSYDVEIGSGTLAELGARVVGSVGLTSRAFLVVDAGLPLATVDVAHASLARSGCRVDIATLRPDEKAKSVTTWARVIDQVAVAGLERGDPIVALGGGVVGDIAGFAAATYRRGVPFVQCPTTLLAMVDASVGGKTGVNLRLTVDSSPLLLKNMIGAFHQPAVVLADVGVLRTLSEREFRCGLAECVKHGLMAADFGQPDLLDWTETNADAIMRRDEAVLADLIARNVRVKAAVIAGDERETAGEGGRALLNLGHTFAHALEGLEDVDASSSGEAEDAALRHGEAVALGLICAARLAQTLGRGAAGLGDRLATLLERFGLPTGLASMPDLDIVMARIGHDKKTRGGQVRFVLPEAAGRCEVVPVSDRAAILDVLMSLQSPRPQGAA